MGEILIGIVSGIISGAGMGGGTILIFLLSFVMGVEQHIAQATNLIFFIPTSIVAIIVNLKNKNIKLMGKTSEVAAAIQTASMFVLTSDFEGIPNALLEAMSIGLPCISTKCSPGGAELLIEHEKNGLLVDCGNAEQLVAAMKRIADDKKFANCLAENAMQVNTIYSVDCIADLWDQTLVGAK